MEIGGKQISNDVLFVFCVAIVVGYIVKVKYI
jgi:hypothetical protein